MSADASLQIMTADEARRITERIRSALDRFSTSWADLAERVGEAYDRRADLALGYGSWAEYASAEFKPAESLAASVRQQIVGLLSAQGMSTRAIAPVVGVSPRQAAYDRSAGVQPLHTSPETGRITTADGVVIAEVEHIDLATGEVTSTAHRSLPLAPAVERGGTESPAVPDAVEEQESGSGGPPAPRPAQIVGLDGKTYSRPEPKTPRRRSIVDAARDAAYELHRAAEKVERIFSDDRYPKNREQVAEVTRGYLSRTAELLDRINSL